MQVNINNLTIAEQFLVNSNRSFHAFNAGLLLQVSHFSIQENNKQSNAFKLHVSF